VVQQQSVHSNTNQELEAICFTIIFFLSNTAILIIMFVPHTVVATTRMERR
jgi:hypothetical protein